jgi:signal transduction histidine kinase
MHNQLSFFGRLRRSIFLKLVLIFFTTAVLLFVLVGISAHLFSDSDRLLHSKLKENVAQYAELLVKEIGDPPDTNRAAELAAKLGLIIRITNRDLHWSSAPLNLPDRAKLDIHTLESRPYIKIGRYRRNTYLWLQEGEYQYLFAVEHSFFADNAGLFLLSVLGIVALVIGGSYFAVRWLFRPLRWLNDGVVQLAQGNFDHQVPVRKNDELGELAAAFNNMSAKVQEMMRSKEQLLLDVSHELRTPITRMKLALEFVDDKNSRAKIQSDLREMETMISELLESARLTTDYGTLNLLHINIVPLIEKMIKSYNDVPPGIRAIGDWPATYLNIDEERIKTVFSNIFENAVKYSGHQTRPVEIWMHRLNSQWNVHIRDYGHGIPQHDLPHIFEPFYRVDKSRNTATGGYGLGLSLCKKIMNAHGGDITVQSEMGTYTEFSLTFPLE